MLMTMSSHCPWERHAIYKQSEFFHSLKCLCCKALMTLLDVGIFQVESMFHFLAISTSPWCAVVCIRIEIPIRYKIWSWIYCMAAYMNCLRRAQIEIVRQSCDVASYADLEHVEQVRVSILKCKSTDHMYSRVLSFPSCGYNSIPQTTNYFQEISGSFWILLQQLRFPVCH